MSGILCYMLGIVAGFIFREEIGAVLGCESERKCECAVEPEEGVSL